MGKLIIDLSEYEEAQLRKVAAESGVPVSRWVARLIQEQTTDHWPESVRQLAG